MLYTVTAHYPERSHPEVWRSVHRVHVSRIVGSFVADGAANITIEREAWIDHSERDVEARADDIDVEELELDD